MCASVTNFTDFTSTTALLYVVLRYVMLCLVTGNDRVTFCLLVESSQEPFCLLVESFLFASWTLWRQFIKMWLWGLLEALDNN